MNGTLANVLIVDDTPMNVEVLLEMLKDDFDLSFATSGPQALDLLTKGLMPDLILLDIMMPEMDGYEVCAALKANPATRDIPVIFITAKSDLDSETRALAVGGVDCIHKPVNKALVLARITLHLDLERRTQALRLANVELAQHRDHLDALVQSRTVELAAARDAAEAASRAKSAFLANMGHELRTPLNQIILSAHLLHQQSPDETAQETLAGIERTSRHLLGLINDILYYSKSEADLIRLQTSDFDLGRLLDQATGRVRREADDKGLRLVCEIDPKLPAWLHGDPSCLQQILGNLLSNAVKFSERGTIGVRVREIASHHDHRTLRFEVEDQGIGIPPELQDGLFQLFHQGDNSLTRKYAGTGLGLALCKRLVTLMAGEIGVISAPGQGSTFWFSVRLRLGAAPTAGAPDRQVDWTAVGAAITALAGRLAESDCEAMTLWNTSRHLLTPVLREQLGAFEEAITGFDLDAALQLLQASVAATPAVAGCIPGDRFT